MAYATKTDVSTYTGIPESDLPTDIDRLIQRASELIDEFALGRIDLTDPEHVEAAKNATCAQVEYWIQGAGEGLAIQGTVRSFQIGNLSIDYGQPGGGQTGGGELAPRARRHLFLAGLFSRGVGMIGRGSNAALVDKFFGSG